MELLRKISLGLFVVTIIMLAIIMGGLRLAISNIEFFKSEIEYLLTHDVSKDIVFSGVSGAMNRFNPILRIENVSINLPDRSQPLIVDRLEVEFDFWASLREQTPVALEITGKFEQVELVKDESGRWWSHELEIGSGTGETVMPGFAQVLALVPRYLKLDLNRLIIHDQKTATTHQLERVAARINHQGDQFFTQLTAALPEQLGRSILVKSVVGPDRSVVYLNTSNLQLPALAGLFDLEPLGLTEGALDGEIWVNMSGYDVMAINGDLVLKQGLFQVAADKTPVAVDYHARFNAINRKSSWRVTNEIERLKIDGKNVLGFESQLEIVASPGKTLISGWVERLQISSLPVIAGQWLPAKFSQQIAQSKLQGLLQDVIFSIDLEQPEKFKIGGRVLGVSSEAFGTYPGSTKLNLDLVAGANKLGVKLHGQKISLDFGDQFRAPIELDMLELNATARRQASGKIVLAVDEIKARNPDIKISGRMWLEAEPDEPPFMYLRAKFTDAIGGSNSKYMPIKLMPQKTMEWLDSANIKGFVPAGDLQFHGRLQDIRKHARNMSGEFFVDFKVEQADVFFAPGWLTAKNGSGRVLFHNAGVEFDLDRVSYEQLDKAKARGGIANFEKPLLELEIEAQVTTADSVRIWIDTPVGERFRKTIGNLHDLEGNVRTEIQLRLPLSEGEEEQQVNVVVDFIDASAQAQNWGLELSQVNGRLEVTKDTIVAPEMSARFFGDPVDIEIDTDEPGNTVVNVNGLLESRNLLKRLPQTWTRHVQGKSDWQIRLKIANDSAPVEQAFLKINAASNLKNTDITLPRPFDKPGQDSTRVTADLDFFPQQISFKVNLGADLRSQGRLVSPDDQEFELSALDLAFSSELNLKPDPGLNLYGHIPEASLGEWIEFINGLEGTNSDLLGTADLSFDRVDFYGRSLEYVKLQVRQADQRYLGLIESSLIRGSFEVPRKVSVEDPLVVNLEYLRLDQLDQETDYATLLPGELMDFRLRSEALVYHDMLFNDLHVKARVVDDSLYVDKFSFRRDEIMLTGDAQWDYEPADRTHLSSVNTKVKGSNLGEALAGVGFGDSMVGGKINLNGSFTWPAPLPGFKLDNFKGSAKLKIKDGVLNNVEPGSGRFVGLLSLGALPRRLSLDFSDVLIKGMEFDQIDGTYRVAAGVLTTKNTRMDGPAAKIKISGKTGILSRDYDQIIRVTPKIRQTLPVIGAVAAGSTIGWGLLLLQNLFKKSIDDAVEVEYRVTGSWDDPKIELIKAVDENQQELPTIDK